MPTATSAMEFDSIESAIASFKNGNFIIVLDDASRENEGDLIISASSVTPSKMAFMVRHTSGLICTPLPSTLCDHLLLPQMVPLTQSQDPHRTAYTISIDSDAPETTTGISAVDRARTCQTLARKNVKPEDFRRPGHVFPLRAKDGGVRERRGHTEAAIDFCRMAGLPEAGVISELVEDGEDIEGTAERSDTGMMRRDGCLAFGRKWGIRVVTIEDMVGYLERTEGKLPVKNGLNRDSS